MDHQFAPHGMFHWLNARFLPPLLAVSALGLLWFGCWPLFNGEWQGPRLWLNLGLAWVPYLCSLWALASAERHRYSLKGSILPSILWLAFFPNAPYLITDWLYLERESLSVHLWYSIGLFTTFSVAGLLLSVVSLYLMHMMLRVRLGPGRGWGLVLLAVVLSGLGVYLGRFLRLNSWDLVTRPGAVLDDLRKALEKPEHHAGPVRFSVMFGLLLFVGYYVFFTIRRAPHSREEVMELRA